MVKMITQDTENINLGGIIIDNIKKKNLLEYVDTNEFYSIKGISNDNTFMNVDKIKNKTWYDFKCSYLEFYQLPKNKPINVYEIFICNAIIYDANAVCTKIIYIC